LRAQVQRGFGGGGDVAFEVVPDPVPADGEVVIEVRACALNRLDLLQRTAPIVRGFALPHIAGMDVAGVVADRGSLPDGVGPALGDHVIIDPVSTCGVCDRCTTGLAPYCEDLRTVGSTRPGGFAERVAAPADRVYPMPAGMSFVEASTLPVAAMTAYQALASVHHTGGDTVLVNGAGAGVSCALLVLLQSRGSTVITTARGPTKAAKAKAVGYDHVIDLSIDDVVPAVQAITGGRGVDLVIDHVGPALFRQSIQSLRIGATMVLCGTTTGTEATVSLPEVYHWNRSLVGSGGYQQADFPLMLGAMAAVGRPPVIDSVWPFDELDVAQTRFANGEFFGKIVIQF
jgi:NADPH:quinone reductase-like Zn-dependent oxidoreductase